MANVLEFVTSALATSLDISSYIESGTHLPLPPHSKVWAGNITAHGSQYITGKYELVPITLALAVVGTSKTDLDDNLRALVAEITKKNILKWQPESATAAIYYTTYPYDSAEAHTILSKAHRDAFTAYNFTITLMADPFAWGAEETITVIENLVPNWNMENFTVANVPDDWTVTEAGAGSDVTEETANYRYLFGTSAVSLLTTAAGSVASITTTDPIVVDRTKHYVLIFSYYCEEGTLGTLTCTWTQYDAAHAAGTATVITPTVDAVDAWYTSYTTIQPGDFDADCTEIKLELKLTGAAANPTEYSVDGIVFTCSDYLSNNSLTNPCGIVIPPAAILGDVPAPVDVYLTKWDSEMCDTAAVYFGGREEYSASYDPCLSSTTGTVVNNANAVRGVCRSHTIPGNLVLNPGFETVVGVPGSNTETWTNWTATRSGTTMIANTLLPHSGTYLVVLSGAGYGSMFTDFININAALDYRVSIWFRLWQRSGSATFSVSVNCYDAGSALLGAIPCIDIPWEITSWSEAWYTIQAAEWFVGTTKIRIVVRGDVFAVGAGDYIRWDDVALQQVSSSITFDGTVLVDDIKGYVKPFIHYRLNAAQTDHWLVLQGNLDSGGTDITSATELSWAIVDMPILWEYEGDNSFDASNLPTHRYSDSADTSALYQDLQVLFDTTLAAGTVYISALCLIPVDNGYAVLPAEGYQYLILDSQSDMPCILASDIGGIDAAAYITSMRQRFTINPQDGSNYACLIKFHNLLLSQVGQFFADIVLKYRPRYLLVA